VKKSWPVAVIVTVPLGLFKIVNWGVLDVGVATAKFTGVAKAVPIDTETKRVSVRSIFVFILVVFPSARIERAARTSSEFISRSRADSCPSKTRGVGS
jgi:hypothetical protein